MKWITSRKGKDGKWKTQAMVFSKYLILPGRHWGASLPQPWPSLPHSLAGQLELLCVTSSVSHPSWSPASSPGKFFVVYLCSLAVSQESTLLIGLPGSHGSCPAGVLLLPLQFSATPNQPSDFCIWSPSCAGKQSQSWFLDISFRPEITDLLFICLCAQPSPPLVPLNSRYLKVIRKK